MNRLNEESVAFSQSDSSDICNRLSDILIDEYGFEDYTKKKGITKKCITSVEKIHESTYFCLSMNGKYADEYEIAIHKVAKNLYGYCYVISGPNPTGKGTLLWMGATIEDFKYDLEEAIHIALNYKH